MNAKTFFSYLAAAIVAIALITLSGFIGYRVGLTHAPEILTTDTVVVVKVDTLVQEKPVPYSVTVLDTVTIKTVDTLYQEVLVQLPMEEKEYRDSLYRAIVSGYKPSLDFIEVYSPTQTITVTEQVPVYKKTHWGIGISGGWGVTFVDGTVKTGPTISATISYNFITW